MGTKACGWDCEDESLRMGGYGQERGDGSMVSGAIFSNNLFSKIIDIFFTLTWKGGERSDYMFCYLITDNIFSGDRNMQMGACQWDHANGSIHKGR